MFATLCLTRKHLPKSQFLCMKPSHLGWLVTWVCPKIRHVLVGENQEPSEIFMVYHPSFPKTVAILRYIKNLIPSEIRPRHIATPASLGCWPCLGNVHRKQRVDKPFLVGGWLKPSEKWWSSSVGMIIPYIYIVWKIKVMFETTNQFWSFPRFVVLFHL